MNSQSESDTRILISKNLLDSSYKLNSIQACISKDSAGYRIEFDYLGKYFYAGTLDIVNAEQILREMAVTSIERYSANNVLMSMKVNGRDYKFTFSKSKIRSIRRYFA